MSGPLSSIRKVTYIVDRAEFILLVAELRARVGYLGPDETLRRIGWVHLDELYRVVPVDTLTLRVEPTKKFNDVLAALW